MMGTLLVSHRLNGLFFWRLNDSIMLLWMHEVICFCMESLFKMTWCRIPQVQSTHHWILQCSSLKLIPPLAASIHSGSRGSSWDLQWNKIYQAEKLLLGWPLSIAATCSLQMSWSLDLCDFKSLPAHPIDATRGVQYVVLLESWN